LFIPQFENLETAAIVIADPSWDKIKERLSDVSTVALGRAVSQVAYAKELSKRRLHLPFECISRAERIDDEVAAALASLGCFRVWIGSESGSQRILDSMKRKVSVDQVHAAAARLRRHGIEVGMFIMLGFDGERMDDPAGHRRSPQGHRAGCVPDHGVVSDQRARLTTIRWPIDFGRRRGAKAPIAICRSRPPGPHLLRFRAPLDDG
jgi:hypothetical protein